MNTGIWKFTSLFSNERTKNLLNPPPFETIIQSIQNEMKILCCHDEKSTDDNGFSRVVYCLQLSQPLFDLFFNSEHGYRAWYYRSTYDGLSKNAQFIKALLPQLLVSEQTKKAEKNGFSTKKAAESLKSCSAKAWLAENGKKICNGCGGEWSYPQDDIAEILNDRWDKSDHKNAICGRKAPYLTKVRIFGSFLNEQNNEFIPALKRNRAEQIYEFGWS